MQKLEVLIEENAFGSVHPMEVVADAPVSALVPALVEELKLPRADLYGKKLMYQLRSASGTLDEPGGYVLPYNSTLIASGIVKGARLALDPYILEDSGPTDTVSSALRPDTPWYASVDAPSNTVNPALQPNSPWYASATIADAGPHPPSAAPQASPYTQLSSTSSYMPVPPQRQKRPKKSRRTFLLAAGTMVGIGVAGLGYATYRAQATGTLAAWLRSFNRRTTNVITTPTARVAQSDAQLVLPTQAKAAMVFTNHQQIVRVVQWSPDGKWLASGADDKHVFVWSITGAVQHDLQHPASVRALAWSSDNARLVTGSANQVAFFNALSGKTLARSVRHHTMAVNGVAWTGKNQKQVVSGGADMHAFVWNNDNYRSQTEFVQHTTSVTSVSWSADGQTVATASLGGVIRVWSAKNGQELHGYFQDGNTAVRAIAFAPTGMRLATAGDDGNVRIWNGIICQQQANTQFGMQCIDMPQRIRVTKAIVRTLAWSPDGRFLAAGGDDGLIAVFNMQQNNRLLLSTKQKQSVHSLTWSPDGKQLASASGNTVTLWQLM
jgi:WD domain, G-beta repeat